MDYLTDTADAAGYRRLCILHQLGVDVYTPAAAITCYLTGTCRVVLPGVISTPVHLLDVMHSEL